MMVMMMNVFLYAMVGVNNHHWFLLCATEGVCNVWLVHCRGSRWTAINWGGDLAIWWSGVDGSRP